jgi:hypothetical protein
LLLVLVLLLLRRTLEHVQRIAVAVAVHQRQARKLNPKVSGAASTSLAAVT